MTCGIYCLQFEGTDKVYIGQSVNIEHRYSQHKQTLKNNTANYKLQEAYSLYGKPILKILLQCSSTNLNLYEDIVIQYYDASNTGLNIHSSSVEAPTLKGVEHGRCLYSEQQLLDVLNIVYNCPDISFPEIEKFTKVSRNTISAIAAGNKHLWLKERLPIIYAEVLSNKGRRSRQNTYVSDKLSAGNNGIIYPDITSPEGKVYSVTNAYKFAREHNLAGNHLQEVLNGNRKSHKGWKVCQFARQLLKL